MNAIVAEAQKWLGTPYHHQADVLGFGADCAMMPVRVFSALGLIPPDTDPRPYSPSWHLHHTDEVYLQWVEKFGYKVEPPEPGDLALFRFGRAVSHGGIVETLEPDIIMIHADLDAGKVTRCEVRRWAGRLAGYWRIRS